MGATSFSISALLRSAGAEGGGTGLASGFPSEALVLCPKIAVAVIVVMRTSDKVRIA
jgi:hypothetical protein